MEKGEGRDKDETREGRVSTGGRRGRGWIREKREIGLRRGKGY